MPAANSDGNRLLLVRVTRGRGDWHLKLGDGGNSSLQPTSSPPLGGIGDSKNSHRRANCRDQTVGRGGPEQAAYLRSESPDGVSVQPSGAEWRKRDGSDREKSTKATEEPRRASCEEFCRLASTSHYVGHQLGDVLVGWRLPEMPAHAQNDAPGKGAALQGLCGLIGMDFYPIRMPAPKFATEPRR